MRAALTRSITTLLRGRQLQQDLKVAGASVWTHCSATRPAGSSAISSSITTHDRCVESGEDVSSSTAQPIASTSGRQDSRWQGCSSWGWPQHQWWSQAQFSSSRGFAAKAGKGAGPKAPPPSPPPTVDSSGSSWAPPEFRPPRLPRRRNPMKRLTAEQRKLLSELGPTPGTPVSGLRQLGWPLDTPDALALAHDQLAGAVGGPVTITPLVVGDVFQSASFLAAHVAELLEDGSGWGQIEQFFVKAVNGTPEADRSYAGLKVQIKGPVSGKSGMKAGKKVWSWGTTGGADFSVPVDFARRQALTKAGLVGIKVLVSYKKSAIGPNFFTTRGQPPLSLDEVLAMPRPPPPHNTPAAWWNTPGPLQPMQHRAWECFAEGYDPVAQMWQSKRHAVAGLDRGQDQLPQGSSAEGPADEGPQSSSPP